MVAAELVKGEWPELRILDIRCVEAVCLPCSRWSLLVRGAFSSFPDSMEEGVTDSAWAPCSACWLGAEGAAQLARGRWPKLQELRIYNKNNDSHRLGAPHKVCLPGSRSMITWVPATRAPTVTVHLPVLLISSCATCNLHAILYCYVIPGGTAAYLVWDSKPATVLYMQNLHAAVTEELGMANWPGLRKLNIGQLDPLQMQGLTGTLSGMVYRPHKECLPGSRKKLHMLKNA